MRTIPDAINVELNIIGQIIVVAESNSEAEGNLLRKLKISRTSNNPKNDRLKHIPEERKWDISCEGIEEVNMLST